MNGFNGEGVQSGVVLVVKAHSVKPHWTTTKNIDFDEKVTVFRILVSWIAFLCCLLVC